MGGMKRLKRVNACHNQLSAGSIPEALLRETPIDTLRVEGNPMPGLQGAFMHVGRVARSC
jgi:hypothetical protein